MACESINGQETKNKVIDNHIEHKTSNKLKITNPTSNEEFYDNGHQKEVLAYRAKSLIERANKAINQLKSQSKQDEVKTLEEEESKVRALAVQLEQAKTSAELAKIEVDLRAAEITILKELQRLHLDHFLSRRDLKADLIVRGQSLLDKAKVSLKKLSKTNNSREMRFIKTEQTMIEKLINQLTTTSEPEQILQVERKLRISELKMSYYLKGSSHSEGPQNHQKLLKQILEQRAVNLNGVAKEAIGKLQADKKQKDVKTVQADNQLVKNLVKQIKNVKTDANLFTIEHKLTMAENKLSQEINKAMHLPAEN